MRGCLRGVLVFVAVAVVAAGVGVWLLTRHAATTPTCWVRLPAAAGHDDYSFTPEQMQHASTIAAVGMKLGMPAHAATIALATAMQESKLHNLDGGDRDSAGLFQQRPSQGWGTREQVQDPVYAATAFYNHLRQVPDWEGLPITVAAQEVQRSAAPDAYAQWEPRARVAAAALYGQYPEALTCKNIDQPTPVLDLAAGAAEELGTARLSGPHPAERGWAIASWLVAHAGAYGIDRVTFAAMTWTPATGRWSADAAAGPDLVLHRTTGP